MTDKIKPAIGIKPVPMKLFATWEVDRTPPNCIPRLCSLTLSRLVVLKTLGSEVSSISIAVKMQHTRLLQGSRRTLRSNEMALPVNGLLDTELQLHFSLQYPHFLKRDGNKLHVMLQRRKRYKNRTILGYKTLADGIINMSQVLQKPSWYDLELDLYNDGKESKGHKNIIARLTVDSLNSQPVDYEGPIYAHQNGRSISNLASLWSYTTSSTCLKSCFPKLKSRIGEYSDDDEEFSSNDDGSDSEPMLEDHSERKISLPPNARQQNFKQKFISLLKRFRVNEDLHGLDSDRDNKLAGGDMDPAEIEDLFDEFDLSDSGPEMDTLSISSTPKPSLRPFFSSSSRSLLNDAAYSQGSSDTDSIAYSLPRPHLERFFSSSDSLRHPRRASIRKYFKNKFSGRPVKRPVHNGYYDSNARPHLEPFFSSSSSQSRRRTHNLEGGGVNKLDMDSGPVRDSDCTAYSMPRPHLKRFISSSSRSLCVEAYSQDCEFCSCRQRRLRSMRKPILKRMWASSSRSHKNDSHIQDFDMGSGQRKIIGSTPKPFLKRIWSSLRRSQNTDTHLQDCDKGSGRKRRLYSMPKPYLKRIWQSSRMSYKTDTHLKGCDKGSGRKRSIYSMPKPFLKRIWPSSRRSYNTGTRLKGCDKGSGRKRSIYSMPKPFLKRIWPSSRRFYNTGTRLKGCDKGSGRKRSIYSMPKPFLKRIWPSWRKSYNTDTHLKDCNMGSGRKKRVRSTPKAHSKKNLPSSGRSHTDTNIQGGDMDSVPEGKKSTGSVPCLKSFFLFSCCQPPNTDSHLQD